MLAKISATKTVAAAPAPLDARARAADRYQQQALAKEHKMAFFWTATMVALYFDSLATYFSKTLIGSAFPYAAIILMMFVYGIFFVGYPKFKLPKYGYVAAYLLVLSFSVAIISLDEVDTKRFRDLSAAVVAFGAGYACFKTLKSSQLLRKGLLLVGAVYAVVCLIAVLHLFPSLFPVINAIGRRAGEWIVRPEVTTDQNFQICYLAPIALLIALENSTIRLSAILVFTAISAFVLSELQTRSGILVLGATLVMAAIVGMRSRGRIDFRLVALVIIGLLGSLVFLDKILLVFQNIIERFTVSDFDTLDNRTDAFFFTFQHLIDFEWWVPQGYRAYRDLTGAGKPHSNLTAIFVEAGMMGAIGWILAVIVPLIVLGFRWLRKRTDPVADVALCGGASTLVIQLSLNAALVQLVWFWSGAVLAAIMRSEMASTTQANAVPAKSDSASDSASDSGEEMSAAKVPAPDMPAPEAKTERRERGLRQMGADSLRRIDTQNLKRPNTDLKRQRTNLDSPDKK